MVTFSTRTVLYNPHFNTVPQHFCHLQMKPPVLQVLPCIPSSPPFLLIDDLSPWSCLIQTFPVNAINVCPVSASLSEYHGFKVHPHGPWLCVRASPLSFHGMDSILLLHSSTHPPIHPPIHSSIDPSIHPSTHLSIHLSIFHPFITPFPGHPPAIQ